MGERRSPGPQQLPPLSDFTGQENRVREATGQALGPQQCQQQTKTCWLVAQGFELPKGIPLVMGLRRGGDVGVLGQICPFSTVGRAGGRWQGCSSLLAGSEQPLCLSMSSPHSRTALSKRHCLEAIREIFFFFFHRCLTTSADAHVVVPLRFGRPLLTVNYLNVERITPN